MKSKLSNGRENKIYIIMLVALGILFGVFFTSKSWMYDDSAIAQTTFDKSINGLDQTTIVLRNWEYNPENKLMEVTLETIHTGTDAVEPTFTFKAKGREKKEHYPAKKVYQSKDTMVVHIQHVPNDYQVIGLFVTEHRDKKILKQEYKKQLQNDGSTVSVIPGDIKKSDLPDPEEIIIVGDYRKIKVNKKLQAKSDIAYQEETIRTEMKRIQQRILLLENDNIPFQNELKATLKQEIVDLKQDMAYETNDEKEETKKEIEQKNRAIAGAKEKTKEYESKVEKLNEKYKSREEKLQSLRSPENATMKQKSNKKVNQKQEQAKKKDK